VCVCFGVVLDKLVLFCACGKVCSLLPLKSNVVGRFVVGLSGQGFSQQRFVPFVSVLVL